jgi:CheY-like chemotaxis protein
MDSLALRNELPYLRRYARAITGSQRLGDGAVRMVLETVLEDPAIVQPERPVRLELYRLFHIVWQQDAFGGITQQRPTQLLDIRPRQVLFLSAVEGFTTTDISQIMDLPEAVVDQEINLAHDIIARELKAQILVIEDEAIVAMHIRSIIQEAGHRCLSVARTHSEAVAQAKQLQPELILADIRLADGSSGVDAVKEILEHYEVPVIFVTAYPERLLTGERPEPTFLVTKPFDPQALVATIAQALLLHREADRGEYVEAGPRAAEALH